MIFGRGNAEQTSGEVIKVNRKTVKVKTTESRGMATTWKVPFSLCRHADEPQAAAVAAPTKPTRPDSEVMRDIVGVYGELSPENLTCDGECSLSQGRRRKAACNRRLKALFTEIGRRVSEDEAYATADRDRWLALQRN